MGKLVRITYAIGIHTQTPEIARHFFQQKVLIFSLFLDENICCGTH